VERASEYVGRTLDDHHAAELKADVVGPAYRHQAENNRLADTAAAISGTLFQSGLHVASFATGNFMEASGTAAASLAPANRGQFDRASMALQNRSNTAVEASLLAASGIVARAAVAAGGALVAATAGRAAPGGAVGVGRADGAAAAAAPGGMPHSSLVSEEPFGVAQPRLLVGPFVVVGAGAVARAQRTGRHMCWGQRQLPLPRVLLQPLLLSPPPLVVSLELPPAPLVGAHHPAPLVVVVPTRVGAAEAAAAVAGDPRVVQLQPRRPPLVVAAPQVEKTSLRLWSTLCDNSRRGVQLKRTGTRSLSWR